MYIKNNYYISLMKHILTNQNDLAKYLNNPAFRVFNVYGAKPKSADYIANKGQWVVEGVYIR